jgi:hypothetical protein
MELFSFGIIGLILIQTYIIYKLYKKVNWWEETYHKTKRAHADIVKGLLHYGG